MKILINNKQKLLSANAIAKTESRVMAALSKFGLNITGVELTVVDVNGPRGGQDKECRIVIGLKKMEDVALTMRDASLSKVISQTIQRAERTVTRRIDKRNLQGNNNHSRLTFFQPG